MWSKGFLGFCVAARVAFPGSGFASVAQPTPPVTARNCGAAEIPAERSECAARDRATATAAHERAFEACKEMIAPGLRSQLLEAESSWKRNRRTECAVEVAAYRDEDEDARAFVRSRCLARATRRRTQAMLSAHPQCADLR